MSSFGRADGVLIALTVITGVGLSAFTYTKLGAGRALRSIAAWGVFVVMLVVLPLPVALAVSFVLDAGGGLVTMRLELARDLRHPRTPDATFTDLPAELQPTIDEMRVWGFEPVVVLRDPARAQRMVSLVFVNRHGPGRAQLSWVPRRPNANVAYFVIDLPGGAILTTRRAMNEPPPGEIFQTFPSAGPAQLAQTHISTVDYLLAYGFTPLPVDERTVLDRIRVGHERERAWFEATPWRICVQMKLNTLRGHTVGMGPIWQRPDALATLQQLRTSPPMAST